MLQNKYLIWMNFIFQKKQQKKPQITNAFWKKLFPQVIACFVTYYCETCVCVCVFQSSDKSPSMFSSL